MIKVTEPHSASPSHTSVTFGCGLISHSRHWAIDNISHHFHHPPLPSEFLLWYHIALLTDKRHQGVSNLSMGQACYKAMPISSLTCDISTTLNCSTAYTTVQWKLNDKLTVNHHNWKHGDPEECTWPCAFHITTVKLNQQNWGIICTFQTFQNTTELNLH